MIGLITSVLLLFLCLPIVYRCRPSVWPAAALGLSAVAALATVAQAYT